MFELDLKITALSRRGSWLSVSRPNYPASSRAANPAEGPGLYLRHNGGARLIERELCKLEPVRAGRVVRTWAERATPDGLTISDAKGGTVELVFTGGDSLQLCGSGGLGLRLRRTPVAGDVAHPGGPDRVVLNRRSALLRLGIECLHGDLLLDAPWGPDQCQNIIIDCLPGDDGSWRMAVDGFTSTWVAGRRPGFDRARATVADEFTAFQAALPALPKHWRAAGQAADYLLWSSTVAPRGLFQREGILMSRNWMDNVWSWDYCFNAMALAPGHPKLAVDQFRLEADLQDPWGAYPDAANDVYAHYNYSKPPVQGMAMAWMDRVAPGIWTPAALRPVYESVAAFTDWWLTHRRWPGSQLAHYLHGNDSGWDNSTMFDHGAPLEAPDLNAFLIAQARQLAVFATRLNRKRQAAYWAGAADDLQAALFDRLWAGDRFIARLAASGDEVDCDSLVPCMPLVLGTALPATMRTALVKRLKRFVTPHGVATEDPRSPKYTADGYWRGPVWAPSTLLVVHGLRECGEQALAKPIATGFCKACASQGFAENFDAQTGAGLRDRAYTWTAAAFRSLAAEF